MLHQVQHYSLHQCHASQRDKQIVSLNIWHHHQLLCSTRISWSHPNPFKAQQVSLMHPVGTFESSWQAPGSQMLLRGPSSSTKQPGLVQPWLLCTAGQHTAMCNRQSAICSLQSACSCLEANLSTPGDSSEQVDGAPPLERIVARNGAAVHDQLALAVADAHKADVPAQAELDEVEGACAALVDFQRMLASRLHPQGRLADRSAALCTPVSSHTHACSTAARILLLQIIHWERTALWLTTGEVSVRPPSPGDVADLKAHDDGDGEGCSSTVVWTMGLPQAVRVPWSSLTCVGGVQ